MAVKFAVETSGSCQGQYRMVAVVAEPIDVTPLTDIQARVGARYHIGDPTRADRLHLTLMNLGRPDALWNKMLSERPTLDRPRYDQALERLIAAFDAIQTGELELVTQSLEILKGPNGSCLVVRLVDTKALIKARSPLMTDLRRFLRRCRVDPLAFMVEHPGLRFQTPRAYAPHVTIGRELGFTKVPNLDVGGVKLSFHPAQVKNATIVSDATSEVATQVRSSEGRI